MLVVIERWVSMGDGRVCPQCAALDGQEFEQGMGPHPPLHLYCRCHRKFARVEQRPDPSPPVMPLPPVDPQPENPEGAK